MLSDSTELKPVAEESLAPSIPLRLKLRQRIATARWREMITIVVTVVDFFFVYASLSLIAAFFPAEAGRKGASMFVTGVIIGITPLAVTVFAPLVGYFLPMIRIPFSIVTGLILVGGVYILLGVSIYLPSGWSFFTVCLVLRLIEGIGAAFFTTAGYTLVTQLYPDSAGFVVGLVEVGSGMGYASGPVIGGFLYKAGGYKLPFFVIGGLCFLLAVPIFLILMKSSPKGTRQLLHLGIILKLMKNFIILLLVLGVVLQMAGLGFANTTYSIFLERQFGLTPDKIGLVFLANSVPYAITALLAGKLADKINPRFIVACGLLLTGLGYQLIGPTSILPIQTTLWLSIIGDFMMGTGTGGTIIATFPDVFKVVSSHLPDLAASNSQREKLMGVIAGVISSGMSFGEFVGALIGGGLADLTNFQASASVFGEALLALMVLLLMVTLIDHCLEVRLRTVRAQQDTDTGVK